jgi:hypothetical protein
MEKDDFLINKESFIRSRRENILHYYDFQPKVHPTPFSKSARAHTEWCTKLGRRRGRDSGGLSRR